MDGRLRTRSVQLNKWNLSEEQQKSLEEYWKRLEEHVKPQSNYILNRFYLRNLKQNNRPLNEFLTEAKLLIQNSGYSTDMDDELLRDALVFGVDSDIVRKKCIAEGNKLTLQKAREIARTEEATKMQLEAMANHSQINLLTKKDFSKVKTQPRNKPSKGQKGHKGKNIDKLTNPNLNVGGVVVDHMKNCRNVQQSIQSAIIAIKLDTTNTCASKQNLQV